MSRKGQINTYTCVACGDVRVTIDRDDGVTPYALGCPSCGGTSFSGMYQVDQSLTPEWEWFRPYHSRKLTPAMRDHVKAGGLDIRKIANGKVQP